MMEPEPTPPHENIPHEYVDVEIEAEGIGDPAKESALDSAIKSLPGIVEVSIQTGKLAITYDPLEVTKDVLLETVKKAGFQIKDIETAAASPATDGAVGGGKQNEEMLGGA